MNFTKLYYPTAESASDDPDFLKKILSDDTISIELTVLPTGEPANIIITLLDQILFEGIISEEFSLSQEIIANDWLWSSGELSIQLIDSHSTIQLTKCKLQHIDMLIYPLSEQWIVKQNDLQWIDTSIKTFGTLALTVTNPIFMQVEFLQSGSTFEVDDGTNLIKKYLKKLRI